MRIRLFLSFLPTLLFWTPLASAQQQPVAISRFASSALKFVKSQQTNGSEGYDVGQWRAQVVSTFPSPLGVGKYNVPFEEPSAFVAASVANILAEIQFIAPDRSALSQLAQTKKGFATYRWGSVFHFYPPGRSTTDLAIRQPRFMYLAPQWRGFANTPPDADTTSVSYLVLAYDQALRQGAAPERGGYQISEATRLTLEEFRDEGRRAHMYNSMHDNRETGAYLTWLWNEKDPRMPRNYFSRPEQGTRIPFNKNDVDCVVNANIIKLLTVTRQTSTPGYGPTCDYLNDVTARRDFYHCGMYYPSQWALPYTMATALDLGAKCLEPSRATLLDEVLRKQNADGSWTNFWKARPDLVQSTAWAVNTLLLAGDPRNEDHREAARRGLQFLINKSERNADGNLYWKGEVFYAAIFIARYPVVWRSDAYTTALIAKALVVADERWNLGSLMY